MDFRSEIYKVLLSNHPDLTISKKSMVYIDSLVTYLMKQIAEEAARLTRYNKTNTLTAREIQTAIRMVLTPKLGQSAIRAGTEAVIRYNEN